MDNKIAIHPLIRKPLTLFVIAVVFAISIIAISESYLSHANAGRESENRAMRIWKNKIDGARESNKIIDEYESHYLNLVKNNIVSEENRLNWLETIQAAANARGASSVKYNVSSQQLLDDKNGQHRAQGLKIYRSKMTLDMKMAHEGDLFSILNALQAKAKGLFTVDKCTIESSGKTPANINENIHAYCELGWYTFMSAESEVKKTR